MQTQAQARAAIHALGSTGYEGRIAELKRRLAAQREELESAQALVAQRERWAEEAVEIEKRLFDEALKQVQNEHMVRQREALQGVVAIRARSVRALARRRAPPQTQSQALTLTPTRCSRSSATTPSASCSASAAAPRGSGASTTACGARGATLSSTASSSGRRDPPTSR